jgi:hypothetical protein
MMSDEKQEPVAHRYSYNGGKTWFLAHGAPPSDPRDWTEDEIAVQALYAAPQPDASAAEIARLRKEVEALREDAKKWRSIEGKALNFERPAHVHRDSILTIARENLGMLTEQIKAAEAKLAAADKDAEIARLRELVAYLENVNRVATDVHNVHWDSH